jgi:hypothetical protein
VRASRRAALAARRGPRNTGWAGAGDRALRRRFASCRSGKLAAESIARVIAFLACDVSKHLTGTGYTVEGGIVAAI